uniref:Uncharacterized protein n=1 Tax=Stegastes partitus TaxID=144197 RepID=A0A3B5AES3_9TELE
LNLPRFAIMDRDQLRATQEKFVLEEAQRREARERGDKPWIPRLFHHDSVSSEWTYRHMEYEHTRANRNTADGTQRLFLAEVNGKHRKASSQPSSCSQNTESSSTTPEPTHESSDNEGFSNQCARCSKEVKDIALIEFHADSRLCFSSRNLVALSRQLARQRATDDSVSLTGRHCLILCVLLLSQLLLNYVFT